MAKRTIQISLPKTGEEEWLATRDSFETGWLTQGPRVADFERAFAKRHHSTSALATTSCTTALHLILKGLGIGPGDEGNNPSVYLGFNGKRSALLWGKTSFCRCG